MANLQFETPFKTRALTQAFEESWVNVVPCHLEISDSKNEKSFISLFEYHQGSCPLIDYYRSAVQGFKIKEPIIYGNTLLNWYSSISYTSEKGLDLLIKELTQKYDNNELVILGGITPFENNLKNKLEQKGFKLVRYSTGMYRDLKNINQEDHSADLPTKKRMKLRNFVSRGKKAGVTVIRERNVDLKELNGLIDLTFEELGSSRDLLPPKFFYSIYENISNIDTLVAYHDKKILGFISGVKFQNQYFVLFTAHTGKESLKKYYQSHMLYYEIIKYAKEIGCEGIHIGRDPYTFKKQHGFEPVPLYLAAYQNNFDNEVVSWLEGLEARHIAKYRKELFKGAEDGKES